MQRTAISLPKVVKKNNQALVLRGKTRGEVNYARKQFLLSQMDQKIVSPREKKLDKDKLFELEVGQRTYPERYIYFVVDG